MEGHKLQRPTHQSPLVIPNNHDKKFLVELEKSSGPTDTVPHLLLEKEMELSYRQAIGELLFTAITCRPDILYVVIKFSQHKNHLARIHYMVVKRVFEYL